MVWPRPGQRCSPARAGVVARSVGLTSIPGQFLVSQRLADDNKNANDNKKAS